MFLIFVLPKYNVVDKFFFKHIDTQLSTTIKVYLYQRRIRSKTLSQKEQKPFFVLKCAIIRSYDIKWKSFYERITGPSGIHDETMEYEWWKLIIPVLEFSSYKVVICELRIFVFVESIRLYSYSSIHDNIILIGVV